MNYIVRGIFELKYAIIIGLLIYGVFGGVVFITKKRRSFSWRYTCELALCIYSVLLLKLVGVGSLHFSITGVNYNLIPFVGSSIIPVILNFLLFIPLGVLLPIVFNNAKWSWKKAIAIGAITSLLIEFTQMFGGRYAEIDDVIINALGALIGYLCYKELSQIKKNTKRSCITLVIMFVTIVVGFTAIYFIGDNAEEKPDGFHAVEDNISEIKVYHDGLSQFIQKDYTYNTLISQISNCGSHVIEIKKAPDEEILNDDDYFVEIIFTTPQNIYFENSNILVISDADRVLYNSSKNILYWGNLEYQYCVDYTILNDDFQEYREELLKHYGELEELIAEYFK